MRALVTGATGFVGEKLSHYLLDQGLDVRILVHNPEKAKNFPQKMERISGDVTNLESLITATKEIDVVFHLAGVVGYSPAMRAEMEKVNVQGTKNVVEAIKKNKVKKMLHFSSVVAIGAGFKPLLINENFEYNLHKLNIGYAETKKAAEDCVHAEFKAGNIDVVIVNPSTIYGYGDATKGSRKVQIKVARGEFLFNTPGGVNVIDIEDVCEATLNAVTKGKSGERYILANENFYIKDLFAMIAKEAGVEPPSITLSKSTLLALGYCGDVLEKFGKRGPINSGNAWNSVLYYWYDNSKAKRDLQLKCQPASIAIHNSVQWMKDAGLLKK